MIYKPYKHLVQYYETDQMGIVHHSNYIRWFEEAKPNMPVKVMTDIRNILLIYLFIVFTLFL